MARLAVIPARAGSKRIPDKNIRAFFGRPVIAYSLEAARGSGLFDAIHVSTDSPTIAEVAAGLGARPEFARPAELSGDDVPLRDVLRYVRDQYRDRGREFDCICRLAACAPLMESSDLIAAERLFATHGGRHSVTAVVRMSGSIDRAFTLSDTGILEPLRSDRMYARSQDLPAAYHDAGSFALLAPAHLDREGIAFYRDRLAFVLPRERAVDIDEPEDWRLAELIFAGRRSMPD